MSSQTLAEPRKEMDSHRLFLQSYQSIAETCKQLVPLEKRVLLCEEKLKEGKISPFEAQLLKKDMNDVLAMYDKLDKISNEIRGLRALPSYSKEDEVNAIIETKTYLLAESFKAHSHMMSSKTSYERVRHAHTAEGLSLAEELIAGHISEMGEEFEKIKKELSARKLD